MLNGQIFLNLYEKDPQKPNQTNKQICLIIDSYKKLPFPFITWHKKNSDLKGGYFLARIYRILYHNTFLFFSKMMFIILEHTNIHVYEPYVTEWHANVKTFHHWGSWNIFGLQSKFQSFIKLKITLICNYQHNMCMETHFQSFSFPPCFQSQGNKTVNKFWLSLKLRHDHWAWTYRVWHSLVRSCLLRY